ncbi:MAG: transposase [Phycisphaerales bacterium]
MLDRVKRRLGLLPATLGADKGYDSEDFLLSLEERNIEPHVSCKSRKEIDMPREGQKNEEGVWARWSNQQGQRDRVFKISQRKRRVDEEIFGWLKQFGGLRRARVVGRWKIQQLADVGLATLNMVRMSRCWHEQRQEVPILMNQPPLPTARRNDLRAVRGLVRRPASPPPSPTGKQAAAPWQPIDADHILPSHRML